MPSLNVETLEQLRVNYKDYPCFVETGTLNGDTVRNLSHLFEELNTVEIKEEFYLNAKELSKNHTNIKFYHGDSSRVLLDLIPNLKSPSIFFLDGHWSSGDTGRGVKDCPLVEEINAIKSLFKGKCVVIIDDYRLFGTSRNEDWSDISKERLMSILGDSLMRCYTLPSTEDPQDRLVFELNM